MLWELLDQASNLPRSILCKRRQQSMVILTQLFAQHFHYSHALFSRKRWDSLNNQFAGDLGLRAVQSTKGLPTFGRHPVIPVFGIDLFVPA